MTSIKKDFKYRNVGSLESVIMHKNITYITHCPCQYTLGFLDSFPHF